MPETRRPQRVVLTVIACAFLALGIVLGIVYLRLWTRASEDLTRLLPSTTRAWVSSPPPWIGVTKTLALDRWQSPAELGDALLRTGFLASGETGEIAGLPVDLARDILRGMDAVEIAIVPSSGGFTSMIFVELRDPALRKRVVARLETLVEAVTRHVGFRIDAIHQSPWQRFTGIDPAPPRVVVMEPWIVFAWGDPQGLEDLLDARVGGRRDAIARREGFLERGDRTELRAVIDAASLWLLAHAAVDPDSPAPPVPDGGLVEFLDLVTFVGRVERGDDVGEVYAEVADSELARRLRKAFAPRPHELVQTLPQETTFVLSAATSDFRALAGVLGELLARVSRDFAPEAALLPAEPLVGALSALGGGGEVALALLPGEAGGASGTWTILLRPDSGDVASIEATIQGVAPLLFGGDYAFGMALVDEQRVHAVVPVASADPSSNGVFGGVVWRVRGGLLEVAPDRATLDRLSLARASERTLGRSGRLERARRALVAEPMIELLVDPSQLTDAGSPILGLVARRLAPDFLIAAHLGVEDDRLHLYTNLGLWTVATTIAAADRDAIETFALPGLDPACRAAHFAMCRAYPDAVPCRPFSIGRRARILAACEALRRGGHMSPDPPPDGAEPKEP